MASGPVPIASPSLRGTLRGLFATLVAALLLPCLVPGAVHAAVTYDNDVVAWSSTSGVNPWVSPANFTPGAGTQQILIVAIAGEDACLVSSVSYGGLPMSLARATDSDGTCGNATTDMAQQVYYLMSPPAGGAAITVNFSAAPANTLEYYAVSFSGVGGVGATAAATGSSTAATASLVLPSFALQSSASTLLLMGCAMGAGALTSPTFATSPGTAGLANGAVATAYGPFYEGGAIYAPAAATSGAITYSWTTNSGAETVYLLDQALELVPAPAPILAPCDGCAMTLDAAFNESVWSFAGWGVIGDTGQYCSYAVGCGTNKTTVTGQYTAVWDNTALYLGIKVSDTGTLELNAAAPWNADGVEVFLDFNDKRQGFNGGASTYNDPNTYQWCITYDSSAIVQYHNPTARTILAASVVNPGTGYAMEVKIPWANLGVAPPAAGTLSGFEISLDVSNGTAPVRDHQLAAFNATVSPFDEAPMDWGAVEYQTCVTLTDTPTFTPSVTPTITQTATPSWTPTSSPTWTQTFTPTYTPTWSPTSSPSNTPTWSPTASPTATPSATPTWSPTPSPTATPSPSPTWSPTATPSYTPTYTPTASPSNTPTWSPTASPTASPSASSTWSPTASPTATPSATPTWSPTPSPTATPSASPTGTPTPSASPSSSPTATPSGTPTWSPTASPSGTPTWSPTVSPTATPSATPTGTPTASPTKTPTGSPTPSPTATPSATPTWTPTASPTSTPSSSPTWTPTSSPSSTPTGSPSATPTATPTASPTETATPSASPTASPSASPTASPSVSSSATPTWTQSASPSATPSATPTQTLSASPSATPSPTPTPTPSVSPSGTRTPSLTATPSGTGTPTPLVSPTPTASRTATPSVSPTLGPVSLTLLVYDSSGLLVRTQSAGSAGALVTAVSWSPQPYDPGKGPLQLEAAGWTYDFDGLDGSGAVLRNGVYLFVLESRQGGAGDSVKFQVTVVGEGGVGVILIAAPNPARAGSGSVSISWRPAGQAVELKIYDLNGGLVRDLGTSLSPAAWNLEGPGGARAADGIYLITARVPGQRSPQCFKFALLR